MTYGIPTNIKQAAKLLDRAKPEWYNQININSLDMTRGRCCVIGQLYGGYTDGLSKLFGTSVVNVCNIFGSDANAVLWTQEIMNRRQNKVKIEHDFMWAVEQMKLGKRVKRKHWLDGGYYYCNSITLKIYNNLGNNAVFSIGDFTSNDWELYDSNIKMLSELKPGEKFKFNTADEEWIKINGGSKRHKAINKDFALGDWENDTLVILVK